MCNKKIHISCLKCSVNLSILNFPLQKECRAVLQCSQLVMDGTEFPASSARPKSKSKKTKKVKAASSQPEASSSSVADLIQLELLCKESLATQLKIAETELQLAQLKASSCSPEAAGATPSLSPVKLQSAIEPNASSSPSLPSLPEFPALDQLHSPKKYESTLPNQFLLSTEGMVDYDKLEMAEFVGGYLEFCKVQPESLRVALLNHFQLLMDRAITYSWPRVRTFH